MPRYNQLFFTADQDYNIIYNVDYKRTIDRNLDGENKSNTTGTAENETTSTNNIDNNIVENVECNNTGNSIFCAWTNYSTFNNIRFKNVSEGFDFDKVSNYNIISNMLR